MPNKVKSVHPQSKSVVTFILSLECFFHPIQIPLVFFPCLFLSLINFHIFQGYLMLIVGSAGYHLVLGWCHPQTASV